jgi:hypothetical protein
MEETHITFKTVSPDETYRSIPRYNPADLSQIKSNSLLSCKFNIRMIQNRALWFHIQPEIFLLVLVWYDRPERSKVSRSLFLNLIYIHLVELQGRKIGPSQSLYLRKTREIQKQITCTSMPPLGFELISQCSRARRQHTLCSARPLWSTSDTPVTYESEAPIT